MFVMCTMTFCDVVKWCEIHMPCDSHVDQSHTYVEQPNLHVAIGTHACHMVDGFHFISATSRTVCTLLCFLTGHMTYMSLASHS